MAYFRGTPMTPMVLWFWGEKKKTGLLLFRKAAVGSWKDGFFVFFHGGTTENTTVYPQITKYSGELFQWSGGDGGKASNPPKKKHIIFLFGEIKNKRVQLSFITGNL